MDNAALVMGRERALPLPAVDGSRFVDALDDAGFEYCAAYWLYRSENDDWRLNIVTPLVDRKGQRETYMQLHGILYGLRPELDLTLSYVKAISAADPVYKVLQKVYHVEPGQRPEYVRRSMFEGVVVEEALIYRMT